MQVLVEVERSGFVESQHLGAVAVCDTAGTLLLAAGDPDMTIYPRSSTKPFQALACHRLGTGERFGLDDQALAIACGSHQGEPRQVEAVLKVLAAAGLDEDDLGCPPARASAAPSTTAPASTPGCWRRPGPAAGPSTATSRPTIRSRRS
jgi:L-asparaginase II